MARSTSAALEQTTPDKAGSGVDTGTESAPSAAAFAPIGRLVRVFQEDPRAVYAMAYVQGWERKGGRERYDIMRRYLDQAMETQLQLWSLAMDVWEEPKLALQDTFYSPEEARFSFTGAVKGVNRLERTGSSSPASEFFFSKPADLHKPDAPMNGASPTENTDLSPAPAINCTKPFWGANPSEGTESKEAAEPVDANGIAETSQ